LAHLLQCDLIEYVEGARTFKTTPKGMQALQTYNKMEEMLLWDVKTSKLNVRRLSII
jgi:predicted transcriptional regulator